MCRAQHRGVGEVRAGEHQADRQAPDAATWHGDRGMAGKDRRQEAVREREIEQAFDRIRLIYESVPKTVYILTCIPTKAEINATAPCTDARPIRYCPSPPVIRPMLPPAASNPRLLFRPARSPACPVFSNFRAIKSRLRFIFEIECTQIPGTELFRQQAVTGILFKMPGRALTEPLLTGK